MKASTKNILALIINIVIVIVTAIAMSKFFIDTGDGNMQVRGLSSLKFFTNLSNWFMAITALVSVFFNIRNIAKGSNVLPRTFYLFKFAAAVSVSVTFLTCVFFLAPINVFTLAPYGIPAWKAYLYMFAGNTFYLHFLTPVLSIIVTFCLEKTDSFEKNKVWMGVVPVFLYAILYAVMVAVIGADNGGWRDFYHFTFGGRNYLIFISGIVMFLATYLISIVEWKIYNKVNKVK